MVLLTTYATHDATLLITLGYLFILPPSPVRRRHNGSVAVLVYGQMFQAVTSVALKNPRPVRTRCQVRLEDLNQNVRCKICTVRFSARQPARLIPRPRRPCPFHCLIPSAIVRPERWRNDLRLLARRCHRYLMER